MVFPYKNAKHSQRWGGYAYKPSTAGAGTSSLTGVETALSGKIMLKCDKVRDRWRVKL
jgi:hypothetical protein